MRLDLSSLTVLALLFQSTANAALINDSLLAPKTTFVSVHTETITDLDIPTPVAHIEKREAEPRKAIVNKQWVKEESEKVHGTAVTETPKPWIRTVYGTVKEVVKPSIVGGVVFGAKPPATTDGLEPWVSIKKDGLPKTITPKMKNGKIVNGFPDVKTYYKTATTVTHHQDDLKAHNLEEGEIVEEVEYIDEDDTYVKLSPLQRCTPDFYYKKGSANLDSSEPFCSPSDKQKMRVGLTYFITWYSRFFENAEKVRFHYAYVNEKAHDKGFDKRDLLDESVKKADTELEELSGHVQFAGDVKGAFYSSDWVDNSNGWFALDVDKKWLKGSVYKKVLIAIQPDNVSDEDFSILAAPNFIATFQERESIGKNTKEMRKLQDQTGSDDDFYYVITAIPTVVMLAVLFMYFFLYVNRKHRDLSGLKKPKRSRFGNQGKYNIPLALTDTHKPNKQS